MDFLPKRAEGLWIFFSWIVGGVWGFFVVGVFFNKMLFLSLSLSFQDGVGRGEHV